MGTRFLFIFASFSIVAAGCLLYFLPAGKLWIIYPVLAVGLVVLLIMFRRVVIPAVTATKGMELIASQDFNNRLRKVGERNADKVVTLFNEMIDRLRNERLNNLEQESFLRLLIDASPMGVVMLDFDGRIVMMNQSFVKITGLSDPDDALGKKIEEIPSDLAPRMADVRLGETGIIRRGDVRMYRCYHLSFVQRGFQRHFYLLESLTDEVMKAERRAYEKVIRIMSHEVNNSMGGLKSVLDLLLDTTTEEDMREVIESCSDRCDRMCAFISSYADVVRVPDAVRSTVDLAAQLKTMFPFLQETAGPSVEVRLSLQCDHIPVALDMSLMQQVIVNIVKNAFESIHGEGYVEVSSGVDKGHAWLEISNNGDPISEEVSMQLFTPFFTTKKEGRGLGLTLIAEILKKHGASFKLCTGKDGVTRFHIRF